MDALPEVAAVADIKPARKAAARKPAAAKVAVDVAPEVTAEAEAPVAVKPAARPRRPAKAKAEQA